MKRLHKPHFPSLLILSCFNFIRSCDSFCQISDWFRSSGFLTFLTCVLIWFVEPFITLWPKASVLSSRCFLLFLFCCLVVFKRVLSCVEVMIWHIAVFSLVSSERQAAGIAWRYSVRQYASPPPPPPSPSPLVYACFPLLAWDKAIIASSFSETSLKNACFLSCLSLCVCDQPPPLPPFLSLIFFNSSFAEWKLSNFRDRILCYCFSSD